MTRKSRFQINKLEERIAPSLLGDTLSLGASPTAGASSGASLGGATVSGAGLTIGTGSVTIPVAASAGSPITLAGGL